MLVTRTYNFDGIDEFLGVEPEGTDYVDVFTPTRIPNPHHPDTRKAISEAITGIKRPYLHKGGKLIKDGVVEEFKCMSHFCKKYKLSTGHLCELLQGKRKSVNGWRLWENH